MENEILQQILSKLTSIESDVKDLKQGQDKLEQGQDKLADKVDKLEIRVVNLEDKVDAGLQQQKENTRLIKALIHSTEFSKAEYDSMNLTLAKIQGDTVAISRKINTLERVTADNWGEITILKDAR